jgi:hypothetical protein
VADILTKPSAIRDPQPSILAPPPPGTLVIDPNTIKPFRVP